jgi:anthranilate phosphoribosyltransferase
MENEPLALWLEYKFSTPDRRFDMLSDAMDRLTAGVDLTVSEMEACVTELISGSTAQGEIEAFLAALHHKGEVITELVGGAQALRRHAVPVRFSQTRLVDTCGTGGDGSGTFNISTAAAIVAAACGVFVAKHGNRKITSQSGSADVLVELGVEIACDPAVAQRCLDQAGVCFLFAPQFHPAMRNVSAARQALPFPTIFNLLGPLANPAGVTHQVLGVGKAGVWDLVVGALSELATGTSLAVRGQDGLGELSVLAPSQVAIIRPGTATPHRTTGNLPIPPGTASDVPLPGDQEVGSAVSPHRPDVTQEIWDAADFGLGGGKLSEIQAATPAESAAIIHRVFAGEVSTARNMVVWNAAAAVWVGSPGLDLAAAVSRCQTAIDSGAAAATLAALRETSQSGG